MTLVITEVSERFGCVVVGDTAVTVRNRGKTDVVLGAEKVHFSAEATIGFAIWGNACLSGQRIDELVANFVGSLPRTASPRSAGRDLVALLCGLGAADGRSWSDLRGGVHICGYENEVPVLFHVHTGADPPEPQGPYMLHEDVQNASAGYHLRNGYYQMFAALYSGMEQYAMGLTNLGFTWPNGSVEDRVSYYSIMVETVARTLEAAARVPSVGSLVSAFAFNRGGMQVNKMLTRGGGVFCRNAGAMASFATSREDGLEATIDVSQFVSQFLKQQAHAVDTRRNHPLCIQQRRS